MTEQSTGPPRSGEIVSVLGYGIAAQDATVEASDGTRLLLRFSTPEGFAVGTALELQYQRDGDMQAATGKLVSRTGNMWWLEVEDVKRVQRRQFVRVPVRDKATLLVSNQAGGEDAFLIELIDVSAGGCKFTHEAPVVEGSRVELRFRVIEGRVHVHAIVLECRSETRGGYRVRARFEDVGEADRARIADWVSHHTFRN